MNELPEELSVDEVKAWRDDTSRPAPLLLDVRNPDEWALVQLPDSTLIPLGALEDRVAELEPHRERPIVVLCHHGVRSLYGAEYLRSLGFRATSMEGGIDAWAAQVDPSLPRY